MTIRTNPRNLLDNPPIPVQAKLAAGAASLAIADGSAFLFVGVSGLAAWLVWLLATGVRLVRSDVD